MSRQQFGDRIDCTPQMVGYVERGERSFGRDHVLSVEALSRTAGPDGTVWPDGPLLASEWHHHVAPSAAESSEPADAPTKGAA